MITAGSISRESASRIFTFLAPDFSGRRNAIRSLTHFAPEYVFWVFPDGRLHDARESHRKNVPKGYKNICDDEPEYRGFLRGRVVRHVTDQLIVVYCRSDALVDDVDRIAQFLRAMEQMPIPLDDGALVISDNGDIYGTLTDIRERLPTPPGR
jgi:hypothetical protein